LYYGQFVGYLNEPNAAGWSSSLRLNYGPVVARYIKLDSFTYRVSTTHADVTNFARNVNILQGCGGSAGGLCDNSSNAVVGARGMRVGVIGNVPSTTGANNAGWLSC
jgi:hypothetical protein